MNSLSEKTKAKISFSVNKEYLKIIETLKADMLPLWHLEILENMSCEQFHMVYFNNCSILVP